MSISPQVQAQLKLSQISARNAAVKEYRLSDGSVRHKCFLSYHSADAEEVLAFVEKFDSVFIPRSIGVSDEDGEIIDSNDVDYVMDTIREKYLTDSTVTIVMVGACTWARRFVDWEIYSSLRNGKVNRINGLMAIQLPSGAQGATLPARLKDNWKNQGSEQDYARYWQYPTSAKSLQTLIEDAFLARTTRSELIDNSRARRQSNSTC